MSISLTPQELIKAGVHFGHETSRWNPNMEPYIFSSRQKIHIIDIRETIRGLIVAREFIKNVVADGKRILVVGTKFQAREIVRRKASDNDIPYVVDRWLGGTLTNFQTIRSRLERLEEIEQWEEDGTIDLYSKKEQSRILREKNKLLRNLGGIRDMKELPGAVIVIDTLLEDIAVKEANIKDIPIIGLIDTDGDPARVDVPVPCNDEAMRVISLMMDQIVAAKEEGLEKRKKQQQEDKSPAEKKRDEDIPEDLEEEEAGDESTAEQEESEQQETDSENAEEETDKSPEAEKEEDETIEEEEDNTEPEQEVAEATNKE